MATAWPALGAFATGESTGYVGISLSFILTQLAMQRRALCIYIRVHLHMCTAILCSGRRYASGGIYWVRAAHCSSLDRSVSQLFISPVRSGAEVSFRERFFTDWANLNNRYIPLFTGGQFPLNERAQIQLIINEELCSSFEGSSYIARAIKEDFTQRL